MHLAVRAPSNGAPDQLGWQTRELRAPFLTDEEIGQLMVHQILLPLSSRYVPPLYTHIYSSRHLIAKYNSFKEGPRPLAI